jgi:hypothetical protein
MTSTSCEIVDFVFLLNTASTLSLSDWDAQKLFFVRLLDRLPMDSARCVPMRVSVCVCVIVCAFKNMFA